MRMLTRATTRRAALRTTAARRPTTTLTTLMATTSKTMKTTPTKRRKTMLRMTTPTKRRKTLRTPKMRTKMVRPAMMLRKQNKRMKVSDKYIRSNHGRTKTFSMMWQKFFRGTRTYFLPKKQQERYYFSFNSLKKLYFCPARAPLPP
jgi:hypothetical protein